MGWEGLYNAIARRHLSIWCTSPPTSSVASWELGGACFRHISQRTLPIWGVWRESTPNVSRGAVKDRTQLEEWSLL